MARIRTIKPEFWTDEKIVQLPMDVRLFFIGMLNFVDDFGAVENKPDQLKYQIFPANNDFDPSSALDLLEAAGIIEHGINLETGDDILRIRNFEKHQKVDRPTKSKLLPADMGQYYKASIPANVRRMVAIKYGCEPGESKDACCFYCGSPGLITWQQLSNGKPGSWVHFGRLELDHVVPEYEGGETEESNIVLACQYCNRSRGRTDFYDFLNKKYGSPREHSRTLAPERNGREGNGEKREREAQMPEKNEKASAASEPGERESPPPVAPPPSQSAADMAYQWGVRNLDALKGMKDRAGFTGTVSAEVLKFCDHYSERSEFRDDPEGFFQRKFTGWLAKAQEIASGRKKPTSERRQRPKTAADEVTREKVTEFLKTAHPGLIGSWQERHISALVQCSDMVSMREKATEMVKSLSSVPASRSGETSLGSIIQPQA